jgi:thiol-disulfide isomerase/thioredoxin
MGYSPEIADVQTDIHTAFVALTLLASAAIAQPLKPGLGAPAITAAPLDLARPFQGWQAFHGDFVVIDFCATWCAPCIPGLARMAALEKEFSGQPIRFLTVANDQMDRVRTYFAEQGLTLQTYVDGDDHPTDTAYGIVGIPAAAIVDPPGRILAVTPPSRPGSVRPFGSTPRTMLVRTEGPQDMLSGFETEAGIGTDGRPL